MVNPPAPFPSAATGFPPPFFTGVTPRSGRPGGDFGPVLSVITFRTPEEAMESANNTTYGLTAGVWTDKEPHPPHGVRPAGRGGLGQHVQPLRPVQPVRRLSRVRVRPGGWRRAGGLPRGASMAEGRLAVRKTYKLYIGGAFPRSESGRSYLVATADGSPLANAAQASRKDVRDAVVAAARPSRAGQRPPPISAGRCSTGWRKCWRDVTASSSRHWSRGRA